jgi:hypothetical protein
MNMLLLPRVPEAVYVRAYTDTMTQSSQISSYSAPAHRAAPVIPGAGGEPLAWPIHHKAAAAAAASVACWQAVVARQVSFAVTGHLLRISFRTHHIVANTPLERGGT